MTRDNVIMTPVLFFNLPLPLYIQWEEWNLDPDENSGFLTVFLPTLG